MHAYFASLDQAAIGSPVSWGGPEPAPVWLDVACEYTERWHHQQQIRDAVGAASLDAPELFAPVLATFVFALPHTFRAVAVQSGTRVHLRIVGDCSRVSMQEAVAAATVVGDSQLARQVLQTVAILA